MKLVAVRIRNSTRSCMLAEKAAVARGFGTRLVGLIGRKRLSKGEALLIPDCRSIHTWFMRFPIDVVYIGDGGRVVALRTSVRPFRFSRGALETRDVLELPAGTIAATGTRVGDRTERS